MLDNFSVPEFEGMMVEVNIDDVFLPQLFGYYHQRLMANSSVYTYLITSGMTDAAIVNRQLGYCDRTLNRHIKRSITTDGATFRGCMQRLELIKATGHELFRGCLVEPIFDTQGNVISACGVKLGKRVRRNAPQTLFWYRKGVYTEMIRFKLAELGGRYVD